MGVFQEQEGLFLKINMIDLTPYLFLPHSYGELDCIKLLTLFYEQEFGINNMLPTYSYSRKWMKEFSTYNIDAWATNNAKKIPLTDAENFDIMIYKARNGQQLIHFGLYIKPNKMLHVEEGETSRIDTLSSYWMDRLYGIYRLNDLVR